jgi:ankyrin repeat protein
MTKYYKITNKEEIHNNLQYHIGLNTDPEPWNPYGDCEAGGIYFASTDILAFLDYGQWIREVTIPDDEPVYTNPGTPVKYKAHRIVLGPRRKIDLKVIKELIDDGCDPRTYNDWAIRYAASNGYLDIVKYLVSVGCDPRSDNDRAIRYAA